MADIKQHRREKWDSPCLNQFGFDKEKSGYCQRYENEHVDCCCFKVHKAVRLILRPFAPSVEEEVDFLLKSGFRAFYEVESTIINKVYDDNPI